jgi:PleD family two-component response regulator
MNKPTALIIDDDVDISNLFNMVLNLVGYECETANSAKEGLGKLAVYTPGLVLLDMQLDTALGGQDILYQIRSNPRLKDTRVIVVTGHPSMITPVTHLADYCLTKPIDLDRFKKVLDDLKTCQPAPRQSYFCDPVTGMYNAEFYISRLELATERAKRRLGFIFAVCIIQVGVRHASKDEPVDREVFNMVLSDATQSLVHSLRPTDTVARLSNSKLATLHEELENPENIKVIIRRIQTILMPPFDVDGQKYILTSQIGKATNKDLYQQAGDLIALAEHDLETQ